MVSIPLKSYYLSVVNKMLDSFDICKNTETIGVTKHTSRISNIKDNNNKLSSPIVRPNNFSEYESHLYKFKLQYPSNWTINEENNQQVSFTSVIKPNTSPLISKDSSVELLVSVIPNITETTIPFDKLAKELTNIANQDRIGFHLINSNVSIFKGHLSYKIVSTYLDANQHLTIKNMAIVTTINNNIYLFEYFAESSDYDHYLPIIQRMLDSFEAL